MLRYEKQNISKTTSETYVSQYKKKTKYTKLGIVKDKNQLKRNLKENSLTGKHLPLCSNFYSLSKKFNSTKLVIFIKYEFFENFIYLLY